MKAYIEPKVEWLLLSCEDIMGESQEKNMLDVDNFWDITGDL